MKKSILTVLLMFVLVLPVLASNSNKEFSVKAGILFDPAITFDVSGNAVSQYANIPFVLAAEFYYFPKETLGLGLGVSNISKSELKSNSEAQFGFTNIYLGLKPKFAVTNFIDSIYFLGQVGYGFGNMSGADTDGYMNGILYWAMGAGIEKNSFLVELIYSVNYASVEYMMGYMTYSSLGINVGYKFAL